MAGFDYEGARKEGYSDADISDYLTKSHPDFDVQGALQQYTPKEVSDFLSQGQATDQQQESQPQSAPQQESPSALSKAGRVAGQFGLGLLEARTFPYDIAVSASTSEWGQLAGRREFLGEELNDYLDKKSWGLTTPEDDARFETIKAEISDPTLSKKNMEEAGSFRDLVKEGLDIELPEIEDITTRGLIEKATGLNLKPEGILEHAANWVGFIKDPRKIFELGKTGLKIKDIAKAIAPTGTEVLRGAGAGTAMELAQRGEFGPVGTLAAVIVGDIVGHMSGRGAASVVKILSNPKEALAEVAAKFSNSEKAAVQKQILKDFEEAGVQADLGTITDSNLIKFMQSRLAQSGLTGKKLEDLKNTMTKQVEGEYKALADSVGKETFANTTEAGTVLQETVKKIRDEELGQTRKTYKSARSELKPDSSIVAKNSIIEMNNVRKELKPGSLKSAEQKIVLDVLDRLKKDVIGEKGKMIPAKIRDLMGNKIALNDLINYEVQGGAKQFLKSMVKALDRDIIAYGNQFNPKFAREYIRGNKEFSQHAKTFRNKNINSMLNKFNPEEALKQFETIKGIQDMRSILSKSPEGKQLFNDLARLKMDQTIAKNMVDSTTNQIKFGTFSKLLEKGKNQEVFRELLPKNTYSRLKRLQKVSGHLAESAQKFFNASKSGVTLEDAGIVSKVLLDIGHLLSGNPWPLMRTGSGVAGARYLTRLMGDPEFLRLVEEIVTATSNNNVPLMKQLAKQLTPKVKAAINATNSVERESENTQKNL